MNNDNNENLEIKQNENEKSQDIQTEPTADVSDTNSQSDISIQSETEEQADAEHNSEDNSDSMDISDTYSYSDSVEESTESIKKESIKIYSPLVIAALVLALLVVSSSVYFAFFTEGTGNTIFHKISGRTADSLYGTWLYRNGDIATFYTFTEDGRLEVTSGTVTSATGYSIDKTKAGIINVYSSIDSSDDSSSSPLSYSVSKVDGVTTLKVSDPSNQSRPMEMQRSSLPDDFLQPDKDFKADQSIVGTWESEEKDIIITLTAEGRITIQFPTMILNGVYELDDGELTYKYSYSFEDGQETTDSFSYEVEGNSFKFYTDSYEYTLTKKTDK